MLKRNIWSVSSLDLLGEVYPYIGVQSQQGDGQIRKVNDIDSVQEAHITDE